MSNTNQYLTFKLDNEIFGVTISKVREVLDFIKTTKVPQTPDYMIGVINLRGNVVPVVDMKCKFNISVTEKTINTCIIIMEIDFKTETTIIGILADSVQEVIEINESEIEPAPKIGTRIKTEFIKGIGKHNDNFVIILDIDKIFASEGDLNFTSSEISSELNI